MIASGRGASVEDVDGNVFLDCTAGIAVTSTGHSHPDVVKAITAVSGRVEDGRIVELIRKIKFTPPKKN